MKKIACDIDGVIADFLLGFTTAANQMDSSLPVITDGQANEWDLSPWYCDKKTLNKIWGYIRKNKPFFWTELEPLISPGTFRRLVDNCIEVYFITARVELSNFPAQRQTAAWLQTIFNQEHGRFIPQVICSNQKRKVCDVLDIDYYLDDKPNNLVEFDQIGAKGYLLYKPYMKDRMIFSPLHGYLHDGVAIPAVYSVDKFLDKAGIQ